MEAEDRIWQVAVVGVNSAGLFLLEQLKLASDIRVASVADPDPIHRNLASEFTSQLHERPCDFNWDTIDAVFLMDGSDDTADLAIRHRKHLVLGQPWRFSSGELELLIAQAVGCAAKVATRQHRSMEFLAASTAMKTGRIGELNSVRLSSCEQCVPLELSGEVMRAFSYSWLDQLLGLVRSTPDHVFAIRFHDSASGHGNGFTATIEFTNGCAAQIDIQMQSRLSHRTGWMLEGTKGSYRNGRLYSTTSDGEIVDEPLNLPEFSDDLFLSDLISTWKAANAELPALSNAVRVMKLIESIEQSAKTGSVSMVDK